jgi:hypothetical protein
MRGETDRDRLERFLVALGGRVRGPGVVFLTGGATAVRHGWRHATIDIDLKADPEPPGFFEAIAALKDEIDVNVELASPDHFIPPVPGWRERSEFVGSYGSLQVYHYDLYSQALAKLQRGHDRDRGDVEAMRRDGLIDPTRLLDFFRAIRPQIVRYPAIDAEAFAERVERYVRSASDRE